MEDDIYEIGFWDGEYFFFRAGNGCFHSKFTLEDVQKIIDKERKNRKIIKERSHE